MKRACGTRKIQSALCFVAALPPLHENRKVFASWRLCRRFIFVAGECIILLSPREFETILPSATPKIKTKENKMNTRPTRSAAKRRILFITQSAVIAALYVVLTTFISAFNLASGAIQVRISEALTVLPFFTPAAIPGLFIGCAISNIIAGGVVWDVVFGSLATLLGALGTYFLRKAPAPLAPIPPIVANTLIIPFVLRYAYHLEDSWLLLFGGLFVGEVISCGVLGLILLYAIKARNIFAPSSSKRG